MALERRHRPLLLRCLQPAVQQPDSHAGQGGPEGDVGRFRGLVVEFLGFLDQRADPVGLAAVADGRVDALHDFLATGLGQRHRLDRRAAGRQLVDHRHVEVGVCGHRQRAGNRGRGHDQLVRVAAGMLALVAKRHSLVDAEAVLLVDDEERETAETDPLLEEGVGADGDADVAAGERLLGGPAGFARQLAGEQGHRLAERPEPAVKVLPVLLGEEFRRRHQGHLKAGLDRLAGRGRGHHGLAGADVALHQAQHRRARREVGGDFAEHAFLGAGQRERQAGTQAGKQGVRRCDRIGRIAANFLAQQAQRQLVREQFLERQPALRRVAARGEQLDIGAGRRPVHIGQRLDQGRQLEFGQQARRQVVGERAVVDGLERLGREDAQPSLLHAVGGRIDRGQRVLDALGVEAVRAPVLRVGDLQAQRAASRLAIQAQPHAADELRLLGAREVEEAQRQKAAAVADPHQQLAPTPEDDLGELDLTLHHGPVATAQRADRHDFRAVLVAGRQQEQQVLHRFHAELEQLLGERRTDTLQVGHRAPVQWCGARLGRLRRHDGAGPGSSRCVRSVRARGCSRPRPRHRAAGRRRRAPRGPGTARGSTPP